MFKLTILSTLLALSAIPATTTSGVKPISKSVFIPIGCSYIPSLPKNNIDLSDTPDEDIQAYYSELIDYEDSELRGTNLLKNLKPILHNMNFYSYDDVWGMYEITDRDWIDSPVEDIENYDSSRNIITSYKYGTSINSDKGTNPYIHTLYRNKNSDGTTVDGGKLGAWDDHKNSGHNREHVWCQSRGFKAVQAEDNAGAKGPAGTDVHHLIAGDAYVNQSIHNAYPYGNVGSITTDAGSKFSYDSGNLLGKWANDENYQVFEPQDSDKGDIARACFYMAARYNNYANDEGVISKFEPFLELVDTPYTDYDSSVDSTDTTPATMAVLSDLLEWHKLDPVDEYEIHRNNLIFNNYQFNRNPFIDYPEWVDYIWGDQKDTGVADPYSDVINGYKEVPNEITILPSDTFSPALPTTAEGVNKTPTAHTVNGVSINEQAVYINSNKMILQNSNNSYIYNTASVGSIESITLHYPSDIAKSAKVGVYFGSEELSTRTTSTQIYPNRTDYEDTFTPQSAGEYGFFQITASGANVQLDSIEIKLKETPKITLNVSEKTLVEDETYQLRAKSNRDNIEFTSSDNHVVRVNEDGLLRAMFPGTATITASVEGASATCDITVTAKVITTPTNFKLITSADELMEGTQVILAGKRNSEIYTAEPYDTSNSNLKVKQATISDVDSKYITPDENYGVFTIGISENGYTFKDVNNKYLYAAGGTSNNYLKSKTTLESRSYWNITVAGETFEITCNDETEGLHGTMRMYTNSVISCYLGDNNNPVQLYALVKENVQTFVDNYLYLDTYTESLGYCNDTEHAYFSKAKTQLLAMGDAYIKTFQDDDSFNTAQERYETWATFNDEYAYKPGGNNVILLENLMINDDINRNLLFIFATALAVSTLAVLFLRKHKTDC